MKIIFTFILMSIFCDFYTSRKGKSYIRSSGRNKSNKNSKTDSYKIKLEHTSNKSTNHSVCSKTGKNKKVARGENRISIKMHHNENLTPKDVPDERSLAGSNNNDNEHQTNNSINSTRLQKYVLKSKETSIDPINLQQTSVFDGLANLQLLSQQVSEIQNSQSINQKPESLNRNLGLDPDTLNIIKTSILGAGLLAAYPTKKLIERSQLKHEIKKFGKLTKKEISARMLRDEKIKDFKDDMMSVEYKVNALLELTQNRTSNLEKLAEAKAGEVKNFLKEIAQNIKH